MGAGARPGPTVGEAEGRPTAAWVLTTALAEAAGMLVSPGEFYGAGGAGFVRVAAVQPDERIELVAERLAASGHPDRAWSRPRRRRRRARTAR